MTELKNDTTGLRNILKAILFCAIFTGLFVVFSFVKGFIPNSYERLSYGIIGTIAAFLTTWLFLKFDKKSFADIGLIWERTTLQKFFIGMAIGIAIMGVMALSVMYATGVVIEVNKNSNVLHFLFATLPLIPLALMEEIGFRAYPLVLLKDKPGLRISVVITSVLFALYHVANGWTIANAFLGAGVWGIIFALAALYSKGIAMPTGLHYAVNLTTSAFGMANSSIWIVHQKASENSESTQLTTLLIPSIGLLLLGIICLEWLARKKNHG